MNSPDSSIVFSFVIGTLILIALIIFIISFALLFQKRQARYLREQAFLKTHYEQEILRSQIEVQNQALEQLGRELHDNIGQLLTVLKINIGTLQEEVSKELSAPVEELNLLTDLIIGEVRGLAKSLDSQSLQEFGLQQSLAYELQRIRKTRRYETELVIEGIPYRFDFKQEIVLFRIAQELLNNAIKHAQARHLTISLIYGPNQFELHFKDDGKGFDPLSLPESIANAGVGLKGIYQRTTLLGGKCSYQTAIGQGTCVSITIPASKD